MAARELNLFTDVDQGRLITGFLSTIQTQSPRFVFGDSTPISFRALTSNGSNADNPWKEVDLTGKTVRVAIGNPGGNPSSGEFTITYDGSTTTALAYNASAAAIEAALNATLTITASGGVTVNRSSGVIRIIFNDPLVVQTFSADTSALYPTTGAHVAVAIEGDVSTRGVIVIRLETEPAAYAELADDLPPSEATVTVTRVGSATRGTIQTLEFPVIPYAGFYTLEIISVETGPIAWNATAATIQTAIEAVSTVGSGKVTVSGTFPLYTISFDKTIGTVGVVAEMGCDVGSLISPTGRSGTINANTARMIELLDGKLQVSTKLEIEIYTIADGTTWTVLQTECTCLDDVISNIPPSQTGGPVYISEEMLDAVRPPAIVMSTPPVDGTTPSTVLGQIIIVQGNNGISPFSLTHDIWTCSHVDPSIWNPPGDIMRDRDTGILYRNSITAGVPSLNIAYS